MKHLATIALSSFMLMASPKMDGCSDPGASPTPEPSADCTGSFLMDEVNGYNQTQSYAQPYLNVTCDNTYVYVQSNGIPNFNFVQVTPNALKEQNLNWKIPLNAAKASTTTAVYTTGPIGISVTGLPIYAPNEAPADNYGDPVLDGLLDYCNGHTDQSGTYHFHADPTCLFETIDGQVHLVVGYAFDGFPIVAPYETVNSTTKEVKSSYVYVGGSDNAYVANQYKAGSGDLDQCNGMTASDGKYRYYATKTFPYTIGCFSGTVEKSNNANGQVGVGGSTGGGTGTGTGTGTGPTPASCSTDNDCTNACPAGSVGCSCEAQPSGGNACVPTCAKDSDCPMPPSGTLTCDEGMGICIPG